MAETTLADAERALAQASDLETEDAVTVLRTARQNLREKRNDPDVDEVRREELETRLEQRIRVVRARDAYDGGLGSAMNPTEEDAP
ncbi:hypothetical protein [Natrinema gelatinilyticum]|uniref:hypothetical protein n=1 Tax=Natrinema gelatinilyticum TaxID=2961571 RepID=UPI0020C2B58E|nr:hypothetical protein [Natrinema gelatinilyticum]